MSEQIHDRACSPVASAIGRRRSFRIYTRAPLSPAHAETIAGAARLAPSIEGRGAGRAEIVADPGRAAALTRAIMGNLLGKTNLWLRSAPPPAYAVLIADADRGARHGDRHLYNVDVAVAGQIVALCAADLGVGSCWMAAIDMASVSREMGLGERQRVPAVIGLGEPGTRRTGSLLAAGWDAFTRVAVSGRRKRIDQICSLERFGSGQALPATSLGEVASDGRSLLEVVEGLAPSAAFAGKQPSEIDLARIVEAMRLAPSADNAQTWRFVLVQGRDATGRLLDVAGLPIPEAQRPAVAVACAAAPFPVRGVHREQPFSLIDHPIALTHAILIAETLGLAWSLAFAFDHEAVGSSLDFPPDHPVTAILLLDAAGTRATPPYPGWAQLHR